MQVELQPGTYIAAVSGGVDSMSLLHMLFNLPGVHIIVAHVDHGIRQDSQADRKLVQQTAGFYGLPFIYTEARLGAAASESMARHARYHFLFEQMNAYRASAIVTAHHLDDVLETAILNLIRGTGRRGLTSLASHPQLLRPLLKYTKQDILRFAKANGIVWREDSTNQSDAYLRNYIRRQILPRFSSADRARLTKIIGDMQRTNAELDIRLKELLRSQAGATIDRRMFTGLPHPVAKEYLAEWLREHGVGAFDAKTLERLVIKAKTGLPGRQFNIAGKVTVHVEKDTLALSGIER